IRRTGAIVHGDVDLLDSRKNPRRVGSRMADGVDAGTEQLDLAVPLVEDADIVGPGLAGNRQGGAIDDVLDEITGVGHTGTLRGGNPFCNLVEAVEDPLGFENREGPGTIVRLVPVTVDTSRPEAHEKRVQD